MKYEGQKLHFDEENNKLKNLTNELQKELKHAIIMKKEIYENQKLEIQRLEESININKVKKK